MKNACKSKVRKREQADCIVNIVHNPPCKLHEVVLFTGGICPFTGEASCDDCISCEFDADCINYLINADRFGLS